jgi:hypothetical protein
LLGFRPIGPRDGCAARQKDSIEGILEQGADNMPVPIRSGPRRLNVVRAFSLIAVAVVMAGASTAAMADWFGPVRYDPNSDQLIITLMYDGTNPDHHLSVQWGLCRKLEQPRAVGPDGSPLKQPAQQLELRILDDQGNDAAKKTYTKTLQVPLAAVSCRPARVTLTTDPAPPYGPGITVLDIP